MVVAGTYGAAAQDAAPAPRRSDAAPGAVVVGLAVLPGAGHARVQIETVGRVRPHVYQVRAPARLVVEMAGLDFRLPRQLATLGGLVTAVRYGQLGGGRARIVADIREDVRIGAVTSEHVAGRVYRVHVDLVGGSDDPAGAVAAGGLGVAGTAPSNVAASIRPAVGPSTGAASQAVARPEVSPEPPATSTARPVVVLDPGHGGIDPGAVVNQTRLEKAIVLAVGLRVQRLLRQAGRVDVVMTRNTDVFLSLDERIERSRQARADLFLSLHADAVSEEALARVAAGASVYVLSAKASDEIAQRVAEKENAADLVGGLLPKPAEDAGVRSILVDLLTRETEQEARRLRGLLVAEMRRDVPMSRQPLRSAAFHVLKQPETPAALVELGFMTNPVDLGLMRQDGWRDRVAKAIVRAVHRFFSERR